MRSMTAESNAGLQLRDEGLLGTTLCHKPSRIPFPDVSVSARRSPIEVSQPDRIVSQQNRSAPPARSEPKKTSSSFDLAIDNKDLDYGNQGRCYASY